MTNPEDKRILEEAIRLFLQLEASPEDKSLQAQRDAFVAKGEAERKAYQKAVAGWTATGMKPRRSALSIVVLAAGLAGAAFLGADALRVSLVADLSTASQPAQESLESGDIVFLDAGSAIVDDTAQNQDIRSVTVIKGAAFFDVAQTGRPFHVSLGDIVVEVVGTAFETSILDGTFTVEVAQGIVRVVSATQTWQLEAGDRLVWSERKPAQVSDVAVPAVASWRQDQLVVRNMPVAHVVEILDRRIPGRVMILGTGYEDKTVSGSFDLGDPLGALSVLAATQNGRLLSGRPLATILTPGD